MSTLEGQHQRTAEHLVNIAENQGMFFAIAFLVDSQYEREDIEKVLDIMRDRRLGFKKPTEIVR